MLTFGILLSCLGLAVDSWKRQTVRDDDENNALLGWFMSSGCKKDGCNLLPEIILSYFNLFKKLKLHTICHQGLAPPYQHYCRRLVVGCAKQCSKLLLTSEE